MLIVIISCVTLKMKVFLFLLICSLQQMYSGGSLLAFMGLDLGPACITLSQIYKATEVLCKQRNATDLWKSVIECHKPINETVCFYFILFLGPKKHWNVKGNCCDSIQTTSLTHFVFSVNPSVLACQWRGSMPTTN